MTDVLGPCFGEELTTANAAGGMSWRPDTGAITLSDGDGRLFAWTAGHLPDDVPGDLAAHAAAIEAVFAKHDPSKQLPAPVPDSASRLGLMRALKEIGKWDAAKQAIASNADAQEEWDLAISIKRDDPLTSGIIQALGLTSADVDNLLVRAEALTS